MKQNILNLNQRISNDEIINYFNKIINDSKLISTQRYDLKINDTSNYKDFKKIIYYKNQNYYFNKHLMLVKYFTKNKCKEIDYTDINLEILKNINEIIADIELCRMINDNITYKIDPLFYICLIREYAFNDNDKMLRNNYRKIRGLFLTSLVIKENVSHNFLDESYQIMINQSINSTIQNIYKKNAFSKEILSYEYFLNLNTFEMSIIEEKFGKSILNKYLIAFSHLSNAKNNNFSLLNKIMFGKKLNKNEKEFILNDDNFPNQSILDCAQDIQQFNKNAFIKHLIK